VHTIKAGAVKATIVSAVKTSARAARRPPGEPRRLLLDAARELFARKDYRSTTTREIAESAGVTEYLLFRHFGSKAGLFREALVLPFTSIVDEFAVQWQTLVPEDTDEDELARHFVEQIYDVVVEHRGLLLTLVASEAFSEEEVADAGIADIRRALRVLGQISVEGMQLRGMHSNQSELPAHSTMAMIVGMVALRSCRRHCTASCIAATDRAHGLVKPAAAKTFWPASPVTRSTNLPAKS
jgi:AcrR family transcriptional regulator